MQEAILLLAQNIQRLRERRGLSLSALARTAGLSKSTLFNLERGEANPSMDTLWSLADALDVPFATLFINAAAPGMVDVLRAGDAPRVVRDGEGAFSSNNSGHDPHFVIRHMLSLHSRGELEAYTVDVGPGVERPAAPHSRGVIEHVFVTAGRMEVEIGESTERLDVGDRMSFLADRPHVYRGAGESGAGFVVLLDYP